MLRLEKKSVAVIQTVFDRYSHCNDLLNDPFAGLYGTGSACLSLMLHRSCIPRDKDIDLNTYAVWQLVEIFARQVLNNESNITGSSKLEVDATLLIKTINAISAKKAGNIRSLPYNEPSCTLPCKLTVTLDFVITFLATLVHSSDSLVYNSNNLYTYIKYTLANLSLKAGFRS